MGSRIAIRVGLTCVCVCCLWQSSSGRHPRTRRICGCESPAAGDVLSSESITYHTVYNVQANKYFEWMVPPLPDRAVHALLAQGRWHAWYAHSLCTRSTIPSPVLNSTVPATSPVVLRSGYGATSPVVLRSGYGATSSAVLRS
eukprot:3431147-Rhodomonas_salina.4